MMRGSVALTGSASVALTGSKGTSGGAAVERLTAHERQSALTGSARDERRKGRWQYLQV